MKLRIINLKDCKRKINFISNVEFILRYISYFCEMKAMIFAAGLGTRLRPITNDRPKALVALAGKSFLQRSIEFVGQYGYKDIIINIHHFGEKVIEHLERNNNFGVNITISDERDELLDTGGGLKKAQHFLEDSDHFLLFNVDILTDVKLDELLALHQKNNAMATLAVRRRTSSRYLLFDQNMCLDGWRNVKTGVYKFSSNKPGRVSPYAFSGVHILNPKIFSQINEEGKFSIIDLYLRLAQKNKILAFDHSDSLWMDLGTHEKLDTAKELLYNL